MYRIMIVDDDEILRKGLVKNIDWKAHNIIVAAEARNGKEALDRMEEIMPDIVISDIQMPFMNGLVLAEYINQLYPQVKIVLLTAYEEFDYVKKALKFNVCEYVLKYESNENILKAVLHAIKLYDKDTRNEELIKFHRQHLMRNFFREISIENVGKKNIELQMQQLNLDINKKFFGIVSFFMERTDTKDEMELIFKRKEFTKNLEETFELYFKDHNLTVEFFQDKEKINMIGMLDQKEEWCNFLVEVKEIVVELCEVQKMKLTVGIGIIYEGIENLYLSFNEATQVINLRDHITINQENAAVKIINYSEDIENQGTALEIIKRAQIYIQSNYEDESLSLNMIAEQVHLSANYVSTLFKKYKGINISDYIIKVRLDRAKELLVTTNYKTYEIANKIGYTNPQYFSVLFKKSFQMSPTVYRQEHGMDDHSAT